MCDAIVMDSKKLAAKLNEQAKTAVLGFRRRPGLAIIKVGHDPASDIYVRNKMADCNKIGINAKIHFIEADDEDLSDEILLDTIKRLNLDDDVDGIIVQLPLPAGLNTRKILDAIDPSKDVDCLGAINTGRMAIGREAMLPCTPAGIMALMDECLPGLMPGKNAVILGRSDIVGKPLARLMLQRDMTVTVCHSKTDPDYMHGLVKNADIVVSAMGNRTVLADVSPHYIGTWGKVFIDVAMNRDAVGRLCGDIPSSWTRHCLAYTPVPGGVGPMTRAMLMQNVLKAAIVHGKK